MIAIVREKPLSAISVKELTERAGVSRMTFYRNYTSTEDILERYHIRVIPMKVTMDDGRSFLHYPDFRNFSAKDFYCELNKGNYSKSSQVTPQQFVDYFTPILASDSDILYVCFSSGLSGTYQSALLARDELLEQFPEREIKIIDSLCACTGEGVLAVQSGINKYEFGMDLSDNASKGIHPKATGHDAEYEK